MRKLSGWVWGAILMGLSGVASSFPTPAGVWQFNGDLTEASGSGATAVLNGTASTNSAYITDTIGGQSASVMQFTNYALDAGLDIHANLAANGATTATRVNQYSIVMDIKYTSDEGGYCSVLETNHSDGDGEIFFRDPSRATKGFGFGTYFDALPRTQFGDWVRYAMTVDMLTKSALLYRNGQLIGKFVTGSGLVSAGQDGRLALDAGAVRNFSLFTSQEFSGQSGAGCVNSLAVYGQVLTSAEVDQLGGPTASGIPVNPGTPSATLVKASPMCSDSIYVDPLTVGDITQRWAIDGTWTGGSFGYVCYAQNNSAGENSPGSLRLHHPNYNWDHPWVEVNSAVSVGTGSVEYVIDLKPNFNAANENEAATIMIADAAASSAQADGQYQNPEVAVRVFNKTGTIYVQGQSPSSNIGTGTVIATGTTAAGLTSLRIVLNYHNGNWYAFYYVNGGTTFYDFPGFPLATATRAKKVLRITAESFYTTNGYSTWDLDVDNVRVYDGWQTVPVELSSFTME